MKTKIVLLTICSWGLLASCAKLHNAAAQTQLANPGFEEDVANVGNPDGWKIGKDVRLKVVSQNASAGNRALLVEDGYMIVQQDLQIPQLANQQVTLNIDARAVDGNAVFGVRLGYYTDDNKWRDTALLWDKALTTKYQTFTASRKLPANARAGRLWLAIYRSDRKSSFYVDNVQLQIGGLAPEESRRVVALAREAHYFLDRLEAASQTKVTLPQKAAWQSQAQQIAQEAEIAKAELADKLDTSTQTIHSLNVALFGALASGKSLLVAPAPAFERLSPTALPPMPSDSSQDTSSQSTANQNLLALRGEHRAFGLDVATGQTTPQQVTLHVQGLPATCVLTWRRQVFTETWYTKGKTLLADPLTKLAGRDQDSIIEIEPGTVARLYADIDVAEKTPPGEYPLKIELSENDTVVETRVLHLRVLPQTVPSQHMAFYAFGYTNAPVISNHTADAVRDLVTHGVTDIEWAYKPATVFDEQGNLQKADFSAYDRLLKDFGPSPIRFNVFWQPSYPRFQTANGTNLEILSPAWKNALVQLMAAWLQNAQEHGVSSDRITVLAGDEIHSAAMEKSPDESIERYVQIAQLLHDKFPTLKNYLTLTYYAFPTDVTKALPHLDAVLPHIPQPEQLKRNAPPTYNPRQAFEQQIEPMLQQARRERGLQIWSYHVAAGRSDDLLQWNRFYPVLAAATGHTGIGFWAYNASSDSSWDDTDGHLLDYNFVYDGTEDNPLCRQYNITHETVVPSVRWEAVRAGSQDAAILLALQEAALAGKLTAPQHAAFEKIEDQAKRWNGNGDAAREITIAGVEDLSQQLRELYSASFGNFK